MKLRMEALERRELLALTVEVGDHYLLADTPDQEIPIYVSGGDLVQGCNLNVQTGDGGVGGTQSGPRITGIDVETGTIWAGQIEPPINPEPPLDYGQWEGRYLVTQEGVSVAAEGLLATVTVDTTGCGPGPWDLVLGPGNLNGPTDFAGIPATVHDGVLRTNEVLGCYLVYGDSAWDGFTPGITAEDAQAIAPDKTPLRPGETARFANVSSYSRGINEVAIDVARIADPGLINADDFLLRVGNTDDVASWSPGPQPTEIAILEAGGVQGSDRVFLRWADGAIANTWLQIVVTTPDFGLAEPAVYFFGSAMGETGDQPTDNLTVTATDILAIRQHPTFFGNPSTISDPHDVNRDGRVNATDVVIARENVTTAFDDLDLITPSGFVASVNVHVNNVIDVEIRDPQNTLNVYRDGQPLNAALVDAALSGFWQPVVRDEDGPYPRYAVPELATYVDPTTQGER